MARYVEAAAVKSGMVLYGFHSEDQTVAEFVEDILPTADVKLVVRGEWITYFDGGKHRTYCSVCNYEFLKKYNYCPHCGAEMRGGDNGDPKNGTDI